MLIWAVTSMGGGSTLRFVPVYDGAEVHVGERVQHGDGELRLDRLQFHIGPITGYTGGVAFSITDTYRLLDLEDPASLAFALPQRVDSIQFLLGVDSLTNVSGAFGGDLDPTKGMYWAWNSGYINLKLEGRASGSPYPKQAFELHLGGYLPPHRTAQRVVLKADGTKGLVVHVDVRELLREVDLTTRCNVMSPGPEAVRLSQAAKRMFKVHGQ
jgi:hypothetical protein